MRQVSLAIAVAVLIAFVATALQPVSAQQQCPKGKSWDYRDQTCK